MCVYMLLVMQLGCCVCAGGCYEGYCWVFESEFEWEECGGMVWQEDIEFFEIVVVGVGG